VLPRRDRKLFGRRNVEMSRLVPRSSSLENRFWNGIISRSTPGMTATNAEQSEPGTAERAVTCHRRGSILRTGGCESAAETKRSGNPRQERRHQQAIDPNKSYERVLEDIHSVSLNSRPLRKASRRSRSTS
jgi:hypothetical protein